MKSILSMSKTELNQIMQVVAEQLSVINGSSQILELHELKKIDPMTLDVNLTAAVTSAFFNNWQYSDKTRKKKNNDAEQLVKYLTDFSNYENGDLEDKEFFVNEWIKLFNVSRVTYIIYTMKQVKKLRIEHGYTQQEMANLLNISYQAYAHYENGRREPSIDTLVRISEYLDVSLDELLNYQYSHEKVFNYLTEQVENPRLAMRSVNRFASSLFKQLSAKEIKFVNENTDNIILYIKNLSKATNNSQ